MTQEEIFWIIAVHPINGVYVEKIHLTDQDEKFLDEEDGFEDWDEYVEYVTSESLAEYEQRLYTAVAVKDAERLDIIKSLRDE